MKKNYFFLIIILIVSKNLLSQTAPAQVSLAVGTNTVATGQNTFASGLGSQATVSSQFYTAAAIGYSCKATGNNSLAIGVGANASAEQSVVIGNSSLSNGYSCFAFGTFTTASGNRSTAIGAYVGTGGKTGSFAIGDVPGNNTQTNNDADNQMMMRFAGGYKFFLSPTTQAFAINPNGTIGIDQSNANNGNINSSGLIFGNGSGEGIASKRTGGGNQYGLDFYSNFTNRMSITNTGKVGIGTTAPQEMLSVAGSLNIDQNNTSAGSVNSGLTFGSGSGEGISSSRNGGFATNQYGLDLFTNSTSRISITNTGNVGIGINVPAQKLHVVGNILASGTITPSDARYKKDVIPVRNALQKIMSISGYYYSFKTNEFPDMGFDNKKQIGVIAQEVENVAPEVVVTLQNGYKAVDYPKLIPLLIQGIKEQQQQIEELKKLVTELIKNK